MDAKLNRVMLNEDCSDGFEKIITFEDMYTPNNQRWYKAVVDLGYIEDGVIYGEVIVEKYIRRIAGKDIFSQIGARILPKKQEWWIETRMDRNKMVNKEGLCKLEPGFAEAKKTLETIAKDEGISLVAEDIDKLFETMEESLKNAYDKVKSLC